MIKIVVIRIMIVLFRFSFLLCGNSASVVFMGRESRPFVKEIVIGLRFGLEALAKRTKKKGRRRKDETRRSRELAWHGRAGPRGKRTKDETRQSRATRGLLCGDSFLAQPLHI